jgi:hypothetical protein
MDSQAHPDPKRVAADFVKDSLNDSKEPNPASMARKRVPCGSLFPEGENDEK